MLIIDGVQLAQDGDLLHGELAIATLTRFARVLASEEGSIQYKVMRCVDKLSRPQLTYQLSGKCHLICQRCLAVMPYVIAIQKTLTLCYSEQALAQVEEDPEIEGIVVTDKIDVKMLIEDELILTLPYAPRHQHCQHDYAKKTVKSNPFLVLASLKN